MLSIQTPNNAPNSPLFCKLFRWSQNKNSNILISIKVQFVLNRQQQNARFHISACPLFHGQLKVPLLTSKTIKAWGFSKVHVWRLSGTVLTKNNKPFSHRSFAGTASDGTVAHSIYAHSSFTNSFFFFFGKRHYLCVIARWSSSEKSENKHVRKPCTIIIFFKQYIKQT